MSEIAETKQKEKKKAEECTRKYDHITPALIKLNWLPVYYRVLFKVLLLVFKALNGLAPHYVSDLLKVPLKRKFFLHFLIVLDVYKT